MFFKISFLCLVVLLGFCHTEGDSDFYKSENNVIAQSDDGDKLVITEDGKVALIRGPNGHGKKRQERDVYWRSWNGSIPKDAVSAGITENQCDMEAPLYLAQALIDVSYGNAGLQPVSMFKYSKSVKATYNVKVHETNQHIKVLCSSNPEELVWIPINQTANVRANTDCVIAGNEETFNLYFGRTIHEGELKVGKVLAHKNILYIEHIGKEVPIKDNFETLCYKQRLENKKVVTQDSKA